MKIGRRRRGMSAEVISAVSCWKLRKRVCRQLGLSYGLFLPDLQGGEGIFRVE